MMDSPLTLPVILERLPLQFPHSEVVWRVPDGSVRRYRYPDYYRRTRLLASALRRAGLRDGDRVATLCWNHGEHLEAYMGIPVAGGVVHTLNLRLHPQEIAYVVNHAEDRFLIVDDLLYPLFEQFQAHVNFEKVIVVRRLADPIPAGALEYEDFLRSGEGFPYEPNIEDEKTAAAMCYTSGTTGKSKGVLYSHRALVLHALGFALPDCFGISQHDVLMAVAPMFHANAHGLPHVALMLGTKIVLPGRHVDAISVLDLFATEKVTFTTAVPTVWSMVLDALEQNPGRWNLAPGFRAFVGGTAAPEALLRRLDRQGIRLVQIWGMTETTPVATCSSLKAHMADWPEDDQYRVRSRQGRPMPFIDARIANDGGVAPWDGQTVGELQVRGPWVASSYYNAPEANDRWTEDGWLKTGDVATMDADGYVQIVDRAKDLIKSGGEWISSVDLESALAAHADIREAAVIAVPHPKWDERPVAVVVLREGATTTPAELQKFLSTRFAKWQIPDDIIFAAELPHTSTGKLSKLQLRKQFANWTWKNS